MKSIKGQKIANMSTQYPKLSLQHVNSFWAVQFSGFLSIKLFNKSSTLFMDKAGVRSYTVGVNSVNKIIPFARKV